MLTYTLTVRGRSHEDVVLALESALQQITEGRTFGFVSNREGTSRGRYESEGQNDYEYLTGRGWENDGELWHKGPHVNQGYADALQIEQED